MKIEVKGLKINYTVCGEGSPAIVLHGWGAEGTTMNNVVEILKQKYKVYTVDLPGFGTSEKLEKPWDLFDYEDCITKFINKLGLDNVTLVGHSFGGELAICLAYSRLINIKSLILIDAAGIRRKAKGKKKNKIILFKIGKNLINILPMIKKKKEKLLSKLRRKFGSEDYNSLNTIMRESFVKIVNNDISYMFEKVLPTVVIIWGENDMATPLMDAQIMNGDMKNSSLRIIKNAGHYPFLDQKEEFSKVLLNEIRSL